MKQRGVVEQQLTQRYIAALLAVGKGGNPNKGGIILVRPAPGSFWGDNFQNNIILPSRLFISILHPHHLSSSSSSLFNVFWSRLLPSLFSRWLLGFHRSLFCSLLDLLWWLVSRSTVANE
jgi:hypothetical protein